jgi:hypothetical protein
MSVIIYPRLSAAMHGTQLVRSPSPRVVSLVYDVNGSHSRHMRQPFNPSARRCHNSIFVMPHRLATCASLRLAISVRLSADCVNSTHEGGMAARLAHAIVCHALVAERLVTGVALVHYNV